MVQTRVRCPNCSNQITIDVSPGEKTVLTCPNCQTEGMFMLPVENTPLSGGKTSVLEVKALTKIYNGLKAVNDVSFQIQKGEIFGFLGPNGAGKTTTIKSILGLIQFNNGEIRINGLDMIRDSKKAKRFVGYLPEKVAFYGNLTAMQNMRFYAEMKNASKADCESLITAFGLGDVIHKKVGQFSKGMVQRLGMARAMLGNPPILILDEPSGGLDPRGVVLIREKIRELKNQDSTIFVSSHILSEVQEVCDRVGIINKGILVAEDTVSNLGRKLNLKPKILLELQEDAKGIEVAVKNVNGVDHVTIKGKNVEVVCDPTVKAKVIVAIEQAGGNIVNLQTKEPSLEEVFMRYTED